MRYRSYHREIQKATAQMLDVFNDIIIDRRSQANAVQQAFRVPVVYAAKSRILKSLQNRDKTVKLPLISISIGGVARDVSRVHSIHDGLKYQDGSSSMDYTKNTPVPINIKYRVYIVTKYHEDMDQIISNWVVFNNPDIYVVIPHPVQRGKNLKCQVVWDGGLNLTYPEEIEKNTDSRITAETTFEFRTWLFPGLDGEEHEGHRIKRINFTPNICFGDDGIGYLNAFYEVPYTMSMDGFKENVICGLIKSPNFDWLPISGGVSGYFYHQISGCLTGTSLGVNLSGTDLCFLTTENRHELLVVSRHCYLPEGTAAIGLEGYVDYYNSFVTGDLSGLPGTSGMQLITVSGEI